MVRKYLVPSNRINILGLMAGIIILYILYTNQPWWVLSAIGDKPTFKAAIAPYLINIEILDKPVNSPIIKYVVLSGTITYLLTGILCILSSFLPNKPWSKNIIGYRPLVMLILTLTTLYIGLHMVRNMVGVTLPYYGTAITLFQLPYETGTINVYTSVKAEFTRTFYIAVVAALLATCARIVIGISEE